MPLLPKTDVTQNSAGTELYIEFVNATGVYDATDNPGGFNSPNPARNTLAAVFFGNHKKVAADVLAVPETYNPLSVTSFTILLNQAKNGHLEYTVFLFEIFDPIGSYVDDDVVWDNQNPSAPFVKERVASAWVPVTDLSLLIGNDNVLQANDNTFPIPDAAAFKRALNAARIIKLDAKVNNRACGEEEYAQLAEWYNYVDGVLFAATNDFCSGAYAIAETKLEAVLTLKDNIDGQY
jgi:hypothetical protein